MDKRRVKWRAQRLYFEGAMGTMLQRRGLAPGELPELWNLTHPEEIEAVHEGYLLAGCQVMKLNTFGANSLKFHGREGRPTVETVIMAAAGCARRVRERHHTDSLLALDIGPSGRMLQPLGDLPFEDAVDLFGEMVRAGVQAGADLILIETMNDAYETKAAVLAAKENSDLPVVVTNVYDERMKLMTGADPEAMVALLEGLRVDALGANCSLGPAQMKAVIRRISSAASIPVLAMPNAGLPRSENGQTVYDTGAEEYAECMEGLASAGALWLGGCCGTDPEYMRRTIERTRELPLSLPVPRHRSVVSSYSHAVTFGQAPVLIGERINPTGRPEFREALLHGQYEAILQEGIRQEDAGAQILDVNVGLPELDEGKTMEDVVFRLQSVTDCPLQIDTTDEAVMERALRIYNGKAMINSVNGKEYEMEKIFPLAAKYGGLVVALTIDEDGIPRTVEKRVAIAKKIMETARRYGIGSEDLIIDPLAMTVSADNASARVTLEAVARIRGELGLLTSLGISNISFGLPGRESVNSAFFTMALQAGLNAGIINPFSAQMMRAYRCYMALSGQDPHCSGWISYETEHPVTEEKRAVREPAPDAADPVSDGGNDRAQDALIKAIVRGLREQAEELTRERLRTEKPMDIVNDRIIPALDLVGRGFEEKTVFLPQLLVSAEAAKAAFGVIRQRMTEEAAESGAVSPAGKNTILLATVKGDIHDIGKNIVKVLLENYGYAVIDLGKDVAPEKIAETVVREHICLVGVSALMTTTVPSMEETIRLLKKRAPWCKIVAGGAVLTQEYADRIQADFYARDAMETVRIAERVFHVREEK